MMQALPHIIDKKNELMIFDQNSQKVCDNISKSSDKISSPGQ